MGKPVVFVIDEYAEISKEEWDKLDPSPAVIIYSDEMAKVFAYVKRLEDEIFRATWGCLRDDPHQRMFCPFCENFHGTHYDNCIRAEIERKRNGGKNL